MKILVTGATGYIGIPLVGKLVGLGHEVHALYRSKQKTKVLHGSNIQWFKGDLLDRDSLRVAMTGCEAVFHLAAATSIWPRNAELFNKTNLEAPLELINISRQCGVKKIVLTSTAGIFGPSVNKKVNEKTERATGFFSEYEKSKWLLGQQLEKWEGNNPEIVIVNPTRVFGPGINSVSNSVTHMIRQYLGGKFRFLPGDGNKIGNYVYVRDVVEGHLLAMEHGKHKEQYLLGGDNLSYRELFNIVSECSGKRYAMVPVPGYLLSLFARFEETRSNLFKTRPVITSGLVEKFVKHDWIVSSDKAKRELGYAPTDLKLAIEETVNWLLAGEIDNRYD